MERGRGGFLLGALGSPEDAAGAEELDRLVSTRLASQVAVVAPKAQIIGRHAFLAADSEQLRKMRAEVEDVISTMSPFITQADIEMRAASEQALLAQSSIEEHENMMATLKRLAAEHPKSHYYSAHALLEGALAERQWELEKLQREAEQVKPLDHFARKMVDLAQRLG